MNQKKNNKIIIVLIVIVLILILGLGAAYAYFATDLLRSDKELFYKYLFQMSDTENGFVDNKLNEYFTKKQLNPYENEGDFSVNISSQNNKDKIRYANNFNVTFNGQIDVANSKFDQNISINYSDKVNFPVHVRMAQNVIGAQTKYVGSKFVAVKTDDSSYASSDLLESYSDVTETINSIEDIDVNEEINYLKDKYLQIIDSKLTAEKFSSVEENGVKGYKLSLNGEELKIIIKDVLEVLKDDEETLNKINDIYNKNSSSNSSKITKKNIEKIIDNIDDNSDLSSDNVIEVVVYAKNKKLVKVELDIDESKLVVETNKTGNDLQYSILFKIPNDDKSINVYLNAKYTGLQLLQSISEEYELEISNSDGDEKYNYYIKNNVNFLDASDIEDFSNDNAMILNNYEEEQVENFINAVMERLIEVNEKQMDELGLESDENPIQYIFPLSMLSSTIFNGDGISNENINELEVSTFNNKFELYEGTNQKGATVKGLLTVINNNNMIAEDDSKIEEIHFNGDEYEANEQNIILIKSEVEAEEGYRVEFERDESSGKIYRVVINKR